MNDTFDAARIHQAELDREIETLRTERLIQAAAGSRPGLTGRARAGIGRGLISLGTSLVGATDRTPSARARTASTGGQF
jgi:hypothetical protein